MPGTAMHSPAWLCHAAPDCNRHEWRLCVCHASPSYARLGHAMPDLTRLPRTVARARCVWQALEGKA